MNVCKYIYKNKHDFMYIDTEQEPDRMIHKNFNQLIIKSPNITTF